MTNVDMYKYAIAVAVTLLMTARCGDNTKLGTIISDAEASGFTEAVGDAACTVRISPEKAAGCDMVWIHSTDTSFSAEHAGAWENGLREYVEDGGRLVLSMDAVRLLNVWGIEPSEIKSWEYECIDEGFGRKLGFHSRFSHPLFGGDLHGGAYTWHGAEDNICRLNGFDDKEYPSAEGAKVIACQWEYVFLRPDLKLIWETPVGKGSILAIGGCLYFDRPNHDRAILDAFTRSCVRYMTGRASTEIEANFWEDEKPEVIRLHGHHDGNCRICAAEYDPVMPPAPQKVNFPDMGMSIVREATGEYTDVISPHSMAILPERGGIEEIWSQPIMSVRDWRVWVEPKDANIPVCLNSLVPTVEVHPHAVIRRYELDGLKLREIVSSSPEYAVTTVHYEWDGTAPQRIYNDFKSNLRMMWPYDEYFLGSLFYSWSPELNAIVVRDAAKKHVSIVGANVPGHPVLSGQFSDFTYDGGRIQGLPTSLLQAGAVVSYDTEGLDALDFVLSAASTGENDAVNAYREVMENPASVVEASCGHYSDWLASVVNVETPDSAFNDAFRWAQISSAQFISETPELGTALFAGFSSSRRGWGGNHRVSGRPGYAWYFGRDSEWAAFAFLDMGDFKTVRDCIDLLIKYQSPDGKIYHELTTSGVTHYDGADSTPLLVRLMAQYLRISGDLPFIKERYGAMKLAMDYCFSTDRDGDGLIENSNVGHGWLEGGGNLWGFRTEFYLAGLWKAALDDAAYLSSAIGHDASALRYRRASRSVDGPLEKFWNGDKGWYNYAMNADGSYQDEFLVLTAVPVFLGVLDPERSKTMSRNYLSPLLSTDWGSRTVFETSDATGGGAYHPRNVWPLFTGWKSLAEYSEGYFDQGFASLYGSLMTYKSFSSGHIAEVINADSYRNNGITQHQCWSETMTIMPFIEGTLGFSADAHSRRLSLAPRLPLNWNNFKANGLRVREGRISIEMKRDENRTLWKIGGGAGLKCTFSPTFAPGTEITCVKVNGKKVRFSIDKSSAYVVPVLQLRLSEDDTIVEFSSSSGAGALPIYVPAQRGGQSSGFRLIDQSFSDGKLTVTVSGRPGSEHRLRLYVPGGYDSISEEAVSFEDGILELNIAFPQDGQTPYCEKEVIVTI